jgi:hypothetical protein
MTKRKPTRGDVIATLNKLVRDGVIASFRTDLFDKDRSDSLMWLWPCLTLRTAATPYDRCNRRCSLSGWI